MASYFPMGYFPPGFLPPGYFPVAQTQPVAPLVMDATGHYQAVLTVEGNTDEEEAE